MFILIYPIATVIIALILKKRSGRYPIIIALSMVTAILGAFIFIISILDDIYLNLEHIPLIKTTELLYLFSVICLFIHFVWPYKFNIMDAVVSLPRFLIVNQIILAVIILVVTYISSFLTDETIIINIGYLLSGVLFSIFIIRLAFRISQNKATIMLWFLTSTSIVSALLNRATGGYEVNTINVINMITNGSAITFFVIVSIKIFNSVLSIYYMNAKLSSVDDLQSKYFLLLNKIQIYFSCLPLVLHTVHLDDHSNENTLHRLCC